MNLFEYFAIFSVIGFFSALIYAFYRWVIKDINDIKGEDRK